MESIICLNYHNQETIDEVNRLAEVYPSLGIKVVESSPGLLYAQRKIISESRSHEDFVVLYNADMGIKSGSTKKLVSFMEDNPRVHAASGDQEAFQHPSFWYGVYNIVGLNPQIMTPRKYLVGKDFAVRKDSYDVPDFLLSDDTFLSHSLITKFGKDAIASVPGVVVTYMGPKTFQDYSNKVRRLDLERKKMFEAFPEFNELGDYFRKNRIPEEIKKLSRKEKIQLYLHDKVLKECKRRAKNSKKPVWVPLSSTKDNSIFEGEKNE